MIRARQGQRQCAALPRFAPVVDSSVNAAALGDAEELGEVSA